jgi:hypothetical protein
MSETQDAYLDALDALRWLLKNDNNLSQGKRQNLKSLALQLAGEPPKNMIPGRRLKEEADRRRAAEQRVAELEQALKANRLGSLEHGGEAKRHNAVSLQGGEHWIGNLRELD